QVLEQGSPITALAYDLDSRLLVAADAEMKIVLWNLPAGKVGRRFRGHQGRIHALAFAGFGKALGSAAAAGTVPFWEQNTARELRQLPLQVPERFPLGRLLALAPDGKMLALAADGNAVRLLDVASGDQLRLFDGNQGVPRVAFSADGRTLAAANGPSL